MNIVAQRRANKLGNLLGRIGASHWTRGQHKHVANLIGAINREHNRNPAVKIKLSVLKAKTHILRKCNK